MNKAGLFSAILTAFVVQTYPLLQPSSTDIANQFLAANNKMLYLGFSAIASQSPFAPPPMLSLEELPPFQPSTPARWINCLFFISLVLSLAAALFGILVKQWVREYMLWTWPLGTPRENVLVRQYRFESWEAWNVATVISTVPALLEIAMILFLSGVIVLLWTLDDVVAICVTAITSVFLLVVAIFTTLPIFFRRCPYKSPTAWACVLTCQILHQSAIYCLRWCQLSATLLRERCRKLIETLVHAPTSPPADTVIDTVLGTVSIALALTPLIVQDIRRPKWTRLPLGWRDVDLASCRSSSIRLGAWKPKPDDLLKVTKNILPAVPENQPEDSHTAATRDDPVKVLIAEVKESCLLLRALSWVSKSSQNSHVVTYIAECSQAEHSHHGNSLRCLVDLVLSTAPVHPIRTASGHDEWRIFVLQFVLTRRHLPTGCQPGLLLTVYSHVLHRYRIGVSATGDHLIIQQGYTRVADLESILAKYFIPGHHGSDEDWLGIFLLTATLWLEARSMARTPREITANVLNKMADAAHVLYGAALPQSPNLTSPRVVNGHRTVLPFPRPPPSLVYSAHSSESLMTASPDTLLRASGSPEPRPTSLRVPSANEPGSASQDVLGIYELHQQATTPLPASLPAPSPHVADLQSTAPLQTSFALRPHEQLDVGQPPSSEPQPIPSKTARPAATRGDSHTSTRRDHLDWLWALTEERETLTTLYGAEYRRLLHALERAYEQYALRGDQTSIRNTLHRQLETSHSQSVCEVETCPWNGHHCTNKPSYTCDLLSQVSESPALRRWKRAIRVICAVRRVWCTSRPFRIRQHRMLASTFWVAIFIARVRAHRRATIDLNIPPAERRTSFLTLIPIIRVRSDSDPESASPQSPSRNRSKSFVQTVQDRIVPSRRREAARAGLQVIDPRDGTQGRATTFS
ncbi:hypothetical protein PsYK624_118880 [Phanerochaete sordida]|uniref:DUF6535 domain-containing protein n=1 Tax=Phanerochaete sordida TaxID=48140 RepID=A0A9P3GIG8_9APHY|nr:hypothetical protein PsYK624_118880 [Phanerochaete sordida]